MASRPYLRKISNLIAEKGGDDWVFDQIADGKPIQSIADQLGCSRPFLYVWRKAGGPERIQGWKDAKVKSAQAHVENGMKILDELAEGDRVLTAPEVSLAAHRAKYREGMAKMADPSLDPRLQNTGTVINVGTLHLEALQKHGGSLALPENVPEVLEAEVVE